MLSQGYINILKQGVEAWNKWRKEYLDIIPDLRGVKLGRADLRGADLSRANFTGADLGGLLLNETDLMQADFTGANLSGANLFSASIVLGNFNSTDLSWANLTGANLTGANFTETKLGGALLSRADLSGANFTGADLGSASLLGASLCDTKFSRSNLYGVDFSGAHMGGTIFAGVDLSAVKGLDAITHYYPSSIGTDTIYLSRGNIPETFLRGCGLPANFIEQVDSLVNIDPIQSFSCFISYSSPDDSFARRLHNDLQGNRVRAWFSPVDSDTGDRIQPPIEKIVRALDKLVLVISDAAIQSHQVKVEVQKVLEKEQAHGKSVLIPVRIDDALIDATETWATNIRSTRHVEDFTGWNDHQAYQMAFERLMRDLRSDEPQETNL